MYPIIDRDLFTFNLYNTLLNFQYIHGNVFIYTIIEQIHSHSSISSAKLIPLNAPFCSPSVDLVCICCEHHQRPLHHIILNHLCEARQTSLPRLLLLLSSSSLSYSSSLPHPFQFPSFIHL